MWAKRWVQRLGLREAPDHGSAARVPCVTMILNGQRGVSADTALRRPPISGTTPQLWLNLQKTWELRRAEIEAGREIAERVTPRHAVV